MSGIAVGMGKGHVLTKRELPVKPSARKGRTSEKVTFVRKVVREVTGFAPYEKRILELLRIGADKRALKLAKKRLGTHIRARRKREEMSDVLRQRK